MAIVLPEGYCNSIKTRWNAVSGVAHDESDDGTVNSLQLSLVTRYKGTIYCPALNLAEVAELEGILELAKVEELDIQVWPHVYRCTVVSDADYSYHGARLASITFQVQGVRL